MCLFYIMSMIPSCNAFRSIFQMKCTDCIVKRPLFMDSELFLDNFSLEKQSAENLRGAKSRGKKFVALSKQFPYRFPNIFGMVTENQTTWYLNSINLQKPLALWNGIHRRIWARIDLEAWRVLCAIKEWVGGSLHMYVISLTKDIAVSGKESLTQTHPITGAALSPSRRSRLKSAVMEQNIW